MTTKRKAELQRRLSMTSLPKPPDGLLERIKRDIPDDLGMARERFSRFNKLSLAMAASVIVLVGGAFFAVRMLSEMDSAKQAAPTAVLATPTAPPAAAEARSRADSAERDQAVTSPVSNMARVAPAPQKLQVRRNEEQHALEGGVAGGMIAQVATAPPPAAPAPPPPPAAVAESKDITITAQAPVVPAMADAAEAVKVEEKESLAITGQTPVRTMAKSALTQDTLAMSPEIFGISVDRQTFDRIKLAIENGERPAASAADVAALVNYFAGAPDRMRRDAVLELEASSRPVPDPASNAFVRVTVDTARTIHDATLEVAFDRATVATYQRVGGGEETRESIIPGARSVTALYEVTLVPDMRSRQGLATATLTFRGPSGRLQTLTRSVNYGDALASWNGRSRRHRLATLGAIWGETLRASAQGTDVAVKAEELSKQEPRDEKAKELATLATASSRLRSSSPTGSGR